MDYKKIIKSREMRLKIIEFFSFIPDKMMIKLQYKIKTGRTLNLKNPKRFTEKLQWYKLYYKNPFMIQCVDKGDVREYIKECGLKDILNECYGIYDNPDEINFNELPNQFVLKDTLGGGGISVIICKDKKNSNLVEYKKVMKKWVDTKLKKGAGREWPYYSGKKHRVIIEKYLDSRLEDGGLIDYKFFCFNGKVKYVYGISDRNIGSGTQLGIYDRDFNILPYTRKDEHKLIRKLEKPVNYEEMVNCAEILSSKFIHARIDLYSHNNKILFGEITFFDGSGYMCFDPDEFDFELGSNFLCVGGKDNA